MRVLRRKSKEQGFSGQAVGPPGLDHDPRLAVLSAVKSALLREQHVLARRPELLWQQLFNLLQWDEEANRLVSTGPVLARLAASAVPWLRMLVPGRSQSLLAVLELEKRDRSPDAVMACAVSSDGRLIASRSGGGRLTIWDARTGRDLKSFETGPAISVSISPDGRILVAGQGAWEIGSGAELFEWEPPIGAEDCAFSPDGTFVVMAGIYGELGIWDASDGAKKRQLRGHTNIVRSCAVSPDASLILSGGAGSFRTGGADSTVRLWDASSGTELRTLGEHQSDVKACVFTPDGRYAVSASEDYTLKLWDLNSGRLLRTITTSIEIWGCAVSPDGKLIASASADSSCQLWDLKTGELLQSFYGHTQPLTDCAFTPDGTNVVTAGTDGKLSIWAVDRRAMGTAQGHDGRVLALAFSPDGNVIVSGGNDSTLRVWSGDSFEELRTLWGHDPDFATRTFDRKGQLGQQKMVSAGELRHWQPGDRKRIAAAGYLSKVTACAFNWNGEALVSASTDKTLRVWDVKKGKQWICLEGHERSVNDCVFSPDCTVILSASDDKTLRLWDFGTERELRVLSGHDGPVLACDYSPDGRLVVSAGEDGTVRLWDPGSGRELHALSGHEGRVTDCAFSPDNRYAVSAGEDGTLRLWRPAGGAELTTLRAHKAPITGCAVSPNGRYIVSASDDGTVSIWSVAEERRVATIPVDGATAVAFHPTMPRIATGNGAGGIYVIQLIGIECAR